MGDVEVSVTHYKRRTKSNKKLFKKNLAIIAINTNSGSNN